MLHVRHCGYLVSDAHVWSAVVVEVDKAAYDLTGMFPGVELTLAIDTFFLDYAIDALCDGIVRGLVVFRHADGNAMPPKALHVRVATILHATVRVVYQALQIFTPCHLNGLVYGLPQRLKRG